jgi:hypothetical protein
MHNRKITYGGKQYGYMHFYLGMTMTQVMSFKLQSLYKMTYTYTLSYDAGSAPGEF